jgi:hypothetical protein
MVEYVHNKKLENTVTQEFFHHESQFTSTLLPDQPMHVLPPQKLSHSHYLQKSSMEEE